MTTTFTRNRKARNVKGNGTGQLNFSAPSAPRRESLPFLIHFLNRQQENNKPLPVCRPISDFVKEHLAKENRCRP